jgi:glucose-6-phosphate isomerase
MKFFAGECADVPYEFYDEIKKRIAPLVEELSLAANDETYSTHEAFLHLVSDGKINQALQDFLRRKKTEPLKYVFICGIGGSNLSAKAFYEAEFLFLDTVRHRTPQLIFIDTTEGNFLKEVLSIVAGVSSLEEILIIGVTKSGETTETAMALELLIQEFSHKFRKGALFERMIFITDEGSKLSRVGKERNIDTLFIPKLVGGRYSAFSSAGLFPLLTVGIDITSLLQKAKDTLTWCLNKDLNNNPAFASATIMFFHNKKGATIHNLFAFNKSLGTLGKWYEQLLAESVGKEENKEGDIVHEGITPLTSIGPEDLHSKAQLYLGGPRDKITTFLTLQSREEISIPKPQELVLVENLDGKKTEEISSAIYIGTKRAYERKALPFMEIILEDYSDIASFMQFKMVEIVMLGHLLNIDIFNQPAVEIYKKETRDILGSP